MLTYLYRKVGFILKSLFEKFMCPAIFRAAIILIMGAVTFCLPEILLSGDNSERGEII